jgi:hypothetical protein
MNEPVAIYGMQQIVFDKSISNTQNIILSQGREALKAVVRRIIELEDFSSAGSIQNAGTDDRAHSVISDLCYQAGIASTILLDNAKVKQESKVAHQLRMDRIAYVQALCESQKIKIVLLRDRRIRNALTHIDERLADILTEKKNAKWFIDVTIDPSEWQTVKPFEDNYCRCYDFINKKILHLGLELDILKLYYECLALLAAVFGFDGKKINSHNIFS